MTDVNILVSTGIGGDTYLTSGAATNNHGVYSPISTGAVVTNRKILLRFDLSDILAGSTCISAILKLKSTVNSSSGEFNIYKISDANSDWVEGTKNGTTAGAGETCWNAKAADGAGGVTTAWAGSAGLMTAGTDYVNTALSTVTTDLTNGTVYEFPFNEDGLAVLQSWFGAETNNGLLFIRNILSVASFYTGEDATESYRPVLSVTYTEAPTGALLKVNMNAQMQNLVGGMNG